MAVARTQVRVAYNRDRDAFQLFSIHPDITDEILLKTLTPEGMEALVRDSARAWDYRELHQDLAR